MRKINLKEFKEALIRKYGDPRKGRLLLAAETGSSLAKIIRAENGKFTETWAIAASHILDDNIERIFPKVKAA